MSVRIGYFDRFQSKVNVVYDETSCWEWQGSKDGAGYGMFRVSAGKVRRAHRVAFELVHGEVPDGTVFLHSCDNPGCVRPSHLTRGTRAENNADRDQKGRQVAPRGEASGQARLTEQQVHEILMTPRTWGSGAALARRFGVSHSTISHVRNGRNWKWVAA